MTLRVSYNMFGDLVMMYSIKQIKEKVAPICEQWQIGKLLLFGSYARGDATDDSDIDILVDRTGTNLKSLFDMGGLYNDLNEVLGKQIDLITTAALEQKSTKERTPWFYKNLNDEKVKIYG